VIPSPTIRAAALALLLLTAACSDAAEESGRSSSTYVGSAVCGTCHTDQHGRWQGSHHDLAMQAAEEGTVLGDFDGAVFESAGRSTRFRRDGERFLVTTEGPDGDDHEYEVRYTFGVHPLQQYLLEFPGGRLQCLDVAWDTDAGRWFDLNQGARVPHDDPYHWSGRFQTWNLQCADCHSTHFEKGYDPATDTYESRYAEINVGCEACHGAGGAHVELARDWLSGARPEDAPTGFEFNPRKDDPDSILNACAPCHSRRTAITDSHRPGARFADDYRLAFLTNDLYHPDGQILEEVYVHGSFLQSKMHQKGVSCIDCHDPHGLDLWFPGDAACTQCHSNQPPLDRFPTLQAKDYTDRSHHHHDPAGEGARCVACHMPESTYMVIDPRRDHSLRIPRPDLSVKLGTPNACNDCHGDQDASWAAAAVAEWTGVEAPPRHYGEALGATVGSDRETLQALLSLPFDTDSPELVRASAVERLPGGEQITTQAAMALLSGDESDPWIKVAALSALVDSPPQVLAALVPPHLEDEARVVRIEAAQVLAGPAEESLSEADRKKFEAAFAEFEAAQAAAADQPFAHLNLAIVAERRGRTQEARAHYLRALEQDEGFLPAVFNLSTLLDSIGQRQEAEKLLSKAVARFPEEGELHYNLGLLLAGMDRLAEAAESLTQAARLLPQRPRILYNLGLALSATGERPKAEDALLRAQRLAPEDPDYMYALATFYYQDEELERAHEWTTKLIQAVPNVPGPRQLLEDIERKMRGE